MERSSPEQQQLVQQLMLQQAGGGGSWSSSFLSAAARRPEADAEQHDPFFIPSDHHHHHHHPQSLSQLLLSRGLVGDADETVRKMDGGWPETAVHPAAVAAYMAGMKQEAAAAAAAAYSAGEDQLLAGHASLSQLLLQASSPRSCITSSGAAGMLDFSGGAAVPETAGRPHHSGDNSSECNSTTGTGSAIKKARVNQGPAAAASSAQSTLKVRKERLGDRITALHQIVSPFGKTDTASVLQETIGYIRFLLGQIEALSYPYLGHGNDNGSNLYSMQILQQQQHQHQHLINNAGGTKASSEHHNDHHQQSDSDHQEGSTAAAVKRDLRSRGLCLVPVSCTSHFGGGADSSILNGGSDYWASAGLSGVLR